MQKPAYMTLSQFPTGVLSLSLSWLGTWVVCACVFPTSRKKIQNLHFIYIQKKQHSRTISLIGDQKGIPPVKMD